MPQPNIPKGNPAGKRMSNPSHAAEDGCWVFARGD